MSTEILERPRMLSMLSMLSKGRQGKDLAMWGCRPDVVRMLSETTPEGCCCRERRDSRSGRRERVLLHIEAEDRSPYDPAMPTTYEVDDVREVRTAFEQRVEWKRQVCLYRARLEAFAVGRGYRSLERRPGAGHCSKRLLKPSHRCTVMGCYESEPIWLNQLMDHREWLRGDGRWALLGQPYDVTGLNMCQLEEWCDAEGLTLTVLPTSPYSDCCIGLLVEGVAGG